MLTMIAALDRRGAIGRNNQLLWKLPKDMAYFKAYTMGKPVLMGHATALSVGRALPQRLNLVLTANHEAPFPGQVELRSIPDVLAFHHAHRDEEIVVCGGAQVYSALLGYADRLVLTHVEDDVLDADTFFPLVSPLAAGWIEDVSSRVDQDVDASHAQAFSIRTYDRPRG